MGRGEIWTSSLVDVASAWGHSGPTSIYVRQAGEGLPIVLLHGGWGYGIHSFDAVVPELTAIGLRCIAPDRTGYGRSTPLSTLPTDFHRRAARETIALLDALDIGQAILWGHSDGAVIAAWLAIENPRRFPTLVLESFHVWSQKASSRLFFETTAQGGHTLPERTKATLEKDHGARWTDVVAMNGSVWVDLGEAANGPHTDLYGGRLEAVGSKALLLYGASDPRMEPGEMEAALRALSGSQLVSVEGRHVPHAEARAWTSARTPLLDFLQTAAGTILPPATAATRVHR